MGRIVANVIGAGLAAALAMVGAARAQTLSGADLVVAMRHGGYVLVMRHASSLVAPPGPSADRENIGGERQLDEAGRRSARAMGQAMQKLDLPIVEVLSSPTYRALQTARLTGFAPVTAVPELGDGGQSMQAASAAQTDWLRAEVNKAPDPGADRLIVTQLPNIGAAFPALSGDLADGDILVFHPAAEGDAGFVARIRSADWPVLAGGA